MDRSAESKSKPETRGGTSAHGLRTRDRTGALRRRNGLRRATRLALASLIVPLVTGCAVVAVADAAVTVVATGVKVVSKTVGAAVDAVTPDPKPPEK